MYFTVVLYRDFCCVCVCVCACVCVYVCVYSVCVCSSVHVCRGGGSLASQPLSYALLLLHNSCNAEGGGWRARLERGGGVDGCAAS